MVMLQMTWQQSLLKPLKRKPGAPPLGLRNLGNTCYLNSVLQCLTYTPPLANFCLRFLHSSTCDLGVGKEKKGECPFCILERRITRSLNIDAASDSPSKINSCLRIYAQHFRNGRQEDAHEFLRYVIDACHNTCLRLKKLQQQQKGSSVTTNGGDDSGTGETVVKEIFGGALQSQVKCLSCGAESNKVDEIMDISLDILHSASIREALQKFFQPEVLDGNNKYKCDICKKLVAAKKQMFILQAPNVLVIQLKRFEGIYGGKIDKPIAFDEILVLSSHMCKGSQDQHPEYNLFGTIVHSGFSPDSGHYYAYIKDSIGRWYCCNDSYVSVSTLQEVLSERVYILFFSRTKQRPQKGSKTSPSNKLACHDNSRQVSDHQPELYNSTKGTQSSVQKSGGLGKPFHMEICSKNPKANNVIRQLSFNGNESPTTHKSDCVPAPSSSEKALAHDHSETAKSIMSVMSNCSRSTTAQNSVTSAKTMHIKDSSNKDRQTGNSTKCEVDQGDCSQPSPLKELHTPGNSEVVAYEKESIEKIGGSVISMEDKKTGTRSNERNGKMEILEDAQNTKGELCSSGISSKVKEPIANNGSVGVGFSERSLNDGNNSSLNCNVDNIGSSSKSSMKRKIEDDQSCIFLATDHQSRAKVDAFKEAIGKEASMMLCSLGWTDEVYNFMRTRKKLCQGAGNKLLSDQDRKNLLISHAKKYFICKVPDNLKGRLFERVRLFSLEQNSSGT